MRKITKFDECATSIGQHSELQFGLVKLPAISLVRSLSDAFQLQQAERNQQMYALSGLGSGMFRRNSGQGHIF
jgi:hypothetical protein